MCDTIKMEAQQLSFVEEEEKSYTLRKLCSRDIFPMSRIISKIGINEFYKAFLQSDIKDEIMNFIDTLTAAKDENSNEKKDSDTAAAVAGIGVALDIVNTILGNISKCEGEIYTLLSDLSGMSKKELYALRMDVFFEMLVDVVRKEEFKDFIKVVSKLFKSRL